MSNCFKDLGIIDELLKAIKDMDFKEPTEVQRKAIPHILKNQDLIVKSKTGSGKTAVFGIPILQLTDSNSSTPQTLILTPTRELAVQISSDLKKYGKYLSHRTIAVYGQHNINTEIKELKKGATIVVGTPGRVNDHLKNNNLVTKNIRYLVIDEADRMLDMGFVDQVERIIRKTPRERVTLLFSATMPHAIYSLSKEYMKKPLSIEIQSQTKTVDTIKQLYYKVEQSKKMDHLYRLLKYEQPESCMIFCNMKVVADKIKAFLNRKGLQTEVLHGDVPQSARMRILQGFKKHKFNILIATDVAARGLHIDGLALVINYDVPNEKDSYVHRIGRTGRAGQVGKAITFAHSNDIMSLYEIEEHIGAIIPEEEFPSDEEIKTRINQTDWAKNNGLKTKSTKTTKATKTKKAERTYSVSWEDYKEKKELPPPREKKGSSFKRIMRKIFNF